MPLDIAPPNFAGLAGLANGNSNVPLTVPGALGLQAVQLNQSRDAANQEAALKLMAIQQQDVDSLRQRNLQQGQLDLARAQLGQQGLLAKLDLNQKGDQFNRSLAADADKLNFLRYQQAQSMGIDQQKIDVANQQNQIDAYKATLTQLAEQKKETLQERGALASYARLAMDNAQSPEEAHQIRLEFLKTAVQKKMITEDEAKLAAQMPLSQFKAVVDHQIMINDAAKEYKTMKDAEQGKQQSGSQVTVRPDGTVEVNSSLTKANETQVQKDLTAANDNLDQLKSFYKSVPENFFGAAALKQPVTKVREWAQSIPGIGSMVEPSSKDKADLTKFSDLKGNTEMMSMNVIKQLSGVQYSDKQLEFLKEIIPDIGPGTVKSEFDGRVKNLYNFFDRIKQARERVLSKGIRFNEDPNSEFGKQMLNELQSAAAPVNDDAFNYYRSQDKYKNLSDDEIRTQINRLRQEGKLQ